MCRSSIAWYRLGVGVRVEAGGEDEGGGLEGAVERSLDVFAADEVGEEEVL